MSTTHRTPLARALPPDTVHILPAADHPAPITMPAGAWGLVLVAARTLRASEALSRLGDTAAPLDEPADVLAGVWLHHQPSPELHRGDVVLRLHPPTHAEGSHTEILAASHGNWRRFHRLSPVTADWPHDLAFTLTLYLRHHADIALAQARHNCPHHRLNPDALSALITAGLLDIGEEVEFGGHTATVLAGGTLGHPSCAPEVSTVSALASRLTRMSVNGWYLWRRARDHRLLADLRTELAHQQLHP